MTVQLGALGREDEELDVVLLASLFAQPAGLVFLLGHELASPVHLDGPDGEGSWQGAQAGKEFG